MDHPNLVAISNCIYQHSYILPDLTFCQSLLLADPLIQLTPFHKIQNENYTVLFFVDLVNADNVGMV